MNKRTVFIAGGTLLSLAALLTTLLAPKPEELDLVGMVQTVESNNEGINQVNGQIVGNMAGIGQLADATGRIGVSLHELQAGVQQQDQSLARLRELSKRQIELSENLHGYAAGLQTDLAGIQQGSSTQKATVGRMIQTGTQLADLAGRIQGTNATIAGKVGQAAEAAAQVARDMP